MGEIYNPTIYSMGLCFIELKSMHFWISQEHCKAKKNTSNKNDICELAMSSSTIKKKIF